MKPNEPPQIPVAPMRRHVHELHDDRRDDPWYWMKHKDDPELLAHLKAESDYLGRFMARSVTLRESLYQDMLATIADEDQSAPWRRGDYYYYRRTRRDLAYPIYCRKYRSLEATEEVLLDQNQLAQDLPYCDLGVIEVSPDHRYLAFSIDDRGNELFRLQFRDLVLGRTESFSIADTCRSLAWANDSRTVFYTTADETFWPCRLHRYRVGDDPAEAELVYEEFDKSFFLSVKRSLSGAYILIDAHSKTSSEVLVLSAQRPKERPRIVQPRAAEVEYHVAHHGHYFYLRTNQDAPNFKVTRISTAEIPHGEAETVVEHGHDVTLEWLSLFAGHMVLHERYDGLPRIRVRGFEDDLDYYLQFGEEFYEVWEDYNEEFDTNIVRCGFSSPVTPYTVYDFNVSNGARVLVKRTPVLDGFRSSDYRAERLFAVAGDGTRVPISIVYPTNLPRDKPQPLLLLGYGSYGSSYPVSFSRSRLALLKRGVAIAIAHVRGGSEMGRSWYEDGKMLNKRNSFTDFIGCAEHLVREGWTTSGQLAAEGASAGGLLVAAAANLRPQLFRVMVADVPFVDVLTTILDDSLPLSVGEREEWGDPRDRRFYDYIKSYSPYDNVGRAAYPAMLVTLGLNDSRVCYWEPLKWVARLRRCTTSGYPLVVRSHDSAGHFGPSGVYGRLREDALAYAYILAQLGLGGMPDPEMPNDGADGGDVPQPEGEGG